MKTVEVSCAQAVGGMPAPPSKSAAHRALIAAALTGQSVIRGVIDSEDMLATLACLSALGYPADRHGDTVRFTTRSTGSDIADCGESGSTLRFFIPLFAALGHEVTFVGRGRLPMRPLTVYEDCLPSHGVCFTRPREDGVICRVSGRLRGGRFEVAGNVSSQFITGLLMALPLCEEDSEIVLTSPLESRGYIDMTLHILALAGIDVAVTDDGYRVRGRQRYALKAHAVEGDWSQAAFLLTAGAVGGDITVDNVNVDSPQGDRRIEAVLREMGADITRTEQGLRARRAALRAVDVDVSDIPDLVPILAVAACAASGTTRLYNAARLRLKESDRLATTAALIRALGGTAEERADELLVTGGTLRGGRVDGANDHRIVMSAAVASLLTDGAVTITDADSVNKSWPTFFESFTEWGGTIHEL